MADVNGTNFRVVAGGNVIAASRTCNFEITVDMIDTTTQDSGGNRTIIPGLFSGNGSVNGLYTTSDTYGVDYIFSTAIAKTQVSIAWEMQETSGKVYTANAYLSGATIEGGTEDNVTYTANIEIDGAVTVSDYTP